MQTIVSLIAKNTGIDKNLVQTALSVIFDVIRNVGDESAVNNLFSKLPWAQELADQGASLIDDEGTNSGLLGGLADSVLSSFGKSGGGLIGSSMTAVGAYKKLKDQGLKGKQIQGIGKDLFNYLNDELGEEDVKNLTSSLPDFSKYL